MSEPTNNELGRLLDEVLKVPEALTSPVRHATGSRV